jgi:Lar family restriction alleviation protein
MNIEDAHKLFREVAVRKDGAPPCPFCGSRNVEAQLQIDDVGWVVACKACDSRGPYTENGGPILAIEAWTRRTTTPKDWLSSEKRGLECRPSIEGERPEGLLPCPFCGHVELVHELEPLLNSVSCLVCNAAGTVGEGIREKAISAWNRRS